MSDGLQIEFDDLDGKLNGVVLIFAGEGLKLGSIAADIDKKIGGQIAKSAEIAGFEGQAKRHIDVLAPPKMTSARILVAGYDSAGRDDKDTWINLGGRVAGLLGVTRSEEVSVVVDMVSASASADVAADLAMGAMLRHYSFDKYKTKPAGDDDEKKADKLKRIRILTAKPDKAEVAFRTREAIAKGVMIARDLVNEPANELGPVEFASECEKLRDLGVDVEILEVEALEELGMRSLLAVAQGSARPARVAVMQWHGAKSKRQKPVCFIGKGVCFDTGGISMKPAGGMEDMKGDMGGAACVTGLMAALAGREAPVNAVGIVGLVENMPSSNAQRPGDIVKSMSGQTIEVINTDAEGRLVLCDLLWYARERFDPRFMINLATLTGAIIVALGKEYAGLFSNDDKLSTQLAAAGEATGEKVWRMPLAKGYDKMIDTPNADMKNIGGRWAGSITAAQFLQRFVKDTPWVHLDVAGVAMASGKTDISRGWASGWGVRLLNELVEADYQK